MTPGDAFNPNYSPILALKTGFLQFSFRAWLTSEEGPYTKLLQGINPYRTR